MEITTSYSSILKFSDKSLVRLIKRSVSPAIADKTTTTSCPSENVVFTILATFLILSILPTDVPPNFITIRDIFISNKFSKLFQKLSLISYIEYSIY